MQNSSTAFQGLRPPPPTPQFPPPDQQPDPHLKCPRCDSTNTKFCYYNNYNLSQPRHFCKTCRRYWTKGGALRNIPVGGGSRKNSKRSPAGTNTTATPSSIANRPNTSTASASTHIPAPNPPMPTFAPPHTLHHLLNPDLLPVIYPSADDQDRHLLHMGATFSSLLTSPAPFATLIDPTFHPVPPMTPHIDGSRLDLLAPGNADHNVNNPAAGTNAAADDFLGFHGVSGCWNGDGGHDGGATASGGAWPGLSINTPGSTFQ